VHCFLSARHQTMLHTLVSLGIMSMVSGILNVPTPIRAAVKLGLVQINYDLLPDWLEVDDVMMSPGMTLKIDAPLRQPEDQWVTFGERP